MEINQAFTTWTSDHTILSEEANYAKKGMLKTGAYNLTSVILMQNIVKQQK